jgi:hypothetical protein
MIVYQITDLLGAVKTPQIQIHNSYMKTIKNEK